MGVAVSFSQPLNRRPSIPAEPLRSRFVNLLKKKIFSGGTPGAAKMMMCCVSVAAVYEICAHICVIGEEAADQALGEIPPRVFADKNGKRLPRLRSEIAWDGQGARAVDQWIRS